MYGDGSVTWLTTPALIRDGIKRTTGSVKSSYQAHTGEVALPRNPVNDGDVSPYVVLATEAVYYVRGEIWNRFYNLR